MGPLGGSNQSEANQRPIRNKAEASIRILRKTWAKLSQASISRLPHHHIRSQTQSTSRTLGDVWQICMKACGFCCSSHGSGMSVKHHYLTMRQAEKHRLKSTVYPMPGASKRWTVQPATWEGSLQAELKQLKSNLRRITQTGKFVVQHRIVADLGPKPNWDLEASSTQSFVCWHGAGRPCFLQWTTVVHVNAPDRGICSLLRH